MDLMQCLRTGRRNAVTREELARLTGRDDRTNREDIQELRRKGAPIISLSSAKGYWLMEDVEELGRFLHETKRRRDEMSYPELWKLYYQLTGVKAVPVRAHVRRVGAKEIEAQVRF